MPAQIRALVRKRTGQVVKIVKRAKSHYATLQITKVGPSGEAQGFSIITRGSYTVLVAGVHPLTTRAGVGTGLTADIVVGTLRKNLSQLLSGTVVNAGTGYVVSDVVKLEVGTPHTPLQDLTVNNPLVYQVVDDMKYPDGLLLQDTSTSPAGPMNTLGFAKHFDGVNTIRNATAQEITAHLAGVSEDSKDLQRESAEKLVINDPQFRRIVKMLFAAMNRIRRDGGLTEWTDLQIQNFVKNNLKRDD